MSRKKSTTHAAVVSLWRYPVKSMMGEELNAADFTEHGLVGDRAYALIDASDGKVASAKNPRKWEGLFDFRAAFTHPPSADKSIPPVRITLPDGTTVTSEDRGVNQTLSDVLGREVRLETCTSNFGSRAISALWRRTISRAVFRSIRPARPTVNHRALPLRRKYNLYVLPPVG